MTDSYKFGGTLSRRLFTLGLVATGTLISGKKAYAHRERYTLTEVEWEDNPGSLYVTHSFHVHETEDVLYKAGVLHKPDLYSLKSRAQLALYASENFTLKDQEVQDIELSLLGAEINGRNCEVYQEAILDNKPTGFNIFCNFMRNLDATQINHVDVKITNTVHSLTFRDKDNVKSISV